MILPLQWIHRYPPLKKSFYFVDHVTASIFQTMQSDHHINNTLGLCIDRRRGTRIIELWGWHSDTQPKTCVVSGYQTRKVSQKQKLELRILICNDETTLKSIKKRVLLVGCRRRSRHCNTKETWTYTPLCKTKDRKSTFYLNISSSHRSANQRPNTNIFSYSNHHKKIQNEKSENHTRHWLAKKKTKNGEGR